MTPEFKDLLTALRNDLSAMIVDIEARLDIEPDEAVEAPAVSKLPPRLQRDFRYLPLDWPMAGGRNFAPAPSDLFRSEAYADSFRPGETREVYVAGCGEALRLAKLAHVPILKAATAGEGRVWERMRELNKDRYGAAWYRGGDYVVDDTGWNDWFPSQIIPQQGPSPNSPVSVGQRSLSVRLPHDLDAAQFDRLFDEQVRMAALDRWVMSEDGGKCCAFGRIDPARLQRFTHYPGGAQGLLSPATELCVLSRSQGVDRLIAISEKIVLTHLGLVDGEGR